MVDPNGWRAGSDPSLRALRVTMVVAMLALLIYIVLRDARPDTSVLALFIGGLLAALFGHSLALPYLGRRRDDE